MSPYLNIPLSRHQSTTRRPRWVVWILAGILLLCVLSVRQISTLWFTHAGALRAAPEGTQVAVQLFLNKRTWPSLEEVLGTVPLLSNRNLTLRDLAPFTSGEIVWFLDGNGNRSVAIRTEEGRLPRSLLDANSVVVQKISNNLYLLSEKLQPVSGMRVKISLSSLLPSFLVRVGSFIDVDTGKITKITQKNRRWTIDLPYKYPGHRTFAPETVPESGYLVLLAPVFTKTESLFDTFIFKDLLTSAGLIILKEAKNPSFLLTTNQNLDENERIRLVQTSLALQYPTKEKKILRDGTVSEEIISDPSLIPVEERIILGREFHHATIGNASIFISKEGEITLSNDEELLKNWLSGGQKRNVSEICNANVGFLSTADLLESNLYPTDVYSNDLLRILAGSMDKIGLERSGNSTKIHLCY